MYALLFAILVLAQASPPSRADISGSARVIDGDTIRIQGLTVRLDGIAAPERRRTCTKDGREWPCGEAAADALRGLVQGSRVECWIKEKDTRGRFVGYCTAAGRDIGGRMVELGWAQAYDGGGEVYVEAEAAARAAGLGLWGRALTPP